MTRFAVLVVLLAGCAEAEPIDEPVPVDESSAAFDAATRRVYRGCTGRYETWPLDTIPGEFEPLERGEEVFDATHGWRVAWEREVGVRVWGGRVELDPLGRIVLEVETLDGVVVASEERTYQGDTPLLATRVVDTDGDGGVDWSFERTPLAADGSLTAIWYTLEDGELVVYGVGEETYVTERRMANQRRVRAADGWVDLELTGTWTEVDGGYRYDAVGDLSGVSDGVWSNTYNRWLSITSRTNTADGGIVRETWTYDDEHFVWTGYLKETGTAGQDTMYELEKREIERDDRGLPTSVRVVENGYTSNPTGIQQTYTWDCP